jgi:site-specific recombinase XerC
VTSIGLEPSAYGTHSMRRTDAAQIYKKTGKLRAVQLLLGHTQMDSTVRYRGTELEDALEISKGVEVRRFHPLARQMRAAPRGALV